MLKRQGFSKSPYPIILSLENHCSLESQDRIAHLLETILGDMIQRPPSGTVTELPSPEKVGGILSEKSLCSDCVLYALQLKHKVLIKAKSHASAAVESDLTLQEDGEEVPEFKKTDLPQQEPAKTKISDRLSRFVVCAGCCCFSVIVVKRLIFLPAQSFKSFEECLESWPANGMASFSELKTSKLIAKDNGAGLKAHNAKFLSRVYPKGSRFDSSNYMPIPAWNANCQVGDF